jgi:cbb3-type cytochrome oxidase maturation protein
MTSLMLLIPAALALGLLALGAFFWSLRSGQYDDVDGAATRFLYDEDRPLPPPSSPHPHSGAPS